MAILPEIDVSAPSRFSQEPLIMAHL